MNPKDQVKENLSIVDVVSTYVRLEKSGAQFRARCPFHNEKTPSFYVSPERKSFHCFGCQLHGDIFTFVEKIENIPFYEALKILADRAGVSLKDAERNKEDGRLIALLKDATIHLENNLKNSPEAKKYLLDRGLTEETLNTFHIGYAKNEWRDIFVFLASKGYSPEEMEQAGLVIKTEKGFYDRFRGRIMFPIRNVSGATVGYSGRILPAFVDPTVAQGKYVNTPETPLYHKSKILFGYDTAKKTMYENKEVVIVEGQMDLCMSYQAGVHNTVAVSGTAFTDEHIHLIKRFADKVILSFDSDSAGQNALKKSALLCLLGSLDVYVVGNIGTKDPADLIMQDASLWHKAIENRVHVIEYITNNLIRDIKDERTLGKLIISDVLPFVRALQSSIDKDYFIKFISNKTGIGADTLKTEVLKNNTVSFETANNTQIVEKVQKPRKEKIILELVAFIHLKNLHNHDDVISVNLDLRQFPEEILQEEMFSLEEKMIGNHESYLKDLIGSYKREIRNEKIVELQKRLKAADFDHQEKIMKEIYDLMKSSS